jgi:hypothetical protein
MRLKDLFSPFIIIPIGLIFLIISLLVFLTKGENKKLISTKLKLGAFLLSFNWFVSGCDPGFSTCYMPSLGNDEISIMNKDTTKYDWTFLPGDTV